MIAHNMKLVTKTRQTRVLYIFSIIAIGALLLVLFLHFGRREVQAPIITNNHDAVLTSGSTSIPVSIAATDTERENGLSGTVSLPEDSGKLFIFDIPSKYGFWMKDMNYSLDLVWIDKDFRIIAISKDVTPESYPSVFYPPSDVKYVLEVNSGFSTTKNLFINQLLTLTNNLSF